MQRKTIIIIALDLLGILASIYLLASMSWLGIISIVMFLGSIICMVTGEILYIRKDISHVKRWLRVA